MNDFPSRLIVWQRTHGRNDLPWQSVNPYYVWLSEIMLQQTQVATVIPYYRRFIASFPTIETLAEASEEQVLTLWSGLGYYARGRNLHAAAQIIVKKYQGEFPYRFEQIIELPGIGRSTAAAICALAFQQRQAILDGNVKRVLARYCGIEGWSGDKKVAEKLWHQSEALMPALPQGEGRGEEARGNLDIATYTQALMDLGATICTRSRPKCDSCPVKVDCVALLTGRVSELPTARPRKTVPERHATVLLLVHNNEILLEKRPSNGIWGGLWCPPQFEDEDTAKQWFLQNGMSSSHGVRLESFSHTFTHFRLHITPLKIQLVSKPMCATQPGSIWLDVEGAMQAAIPAPVRKVLKTL